MKKTKKSRRDIPPLHVPDLDPLEASLVMLWLDYCIQCFEKQLKLWRRIARSSGDAASRGSVNYHQEGIKALRWARGHAEQVAVTRGEPGERGKRLAELTAALETLWHESAL